MVSAASCNDPDEARAAATEWLERLHRVHARVIMVALNPPCQRALFQQAYRTQRLATPLPAGAAEIAPRDAGVTWLTSWVAEDVLIDPATGQPSADAIRGGLGLIGVSELSGPAANAAAYNDTLFAQYVHRLSLIHI